MGEFLTRQSSFCQHSCSEPNHHGNCSKQNKNDETNESRARFCALHCRLQKTIERITIAGIFKPLVGKRLHIGNTLHGFLSDDIALCQTILRITRILANLSPYNRHRQNHHRNRRQHEERELRRGNKDKNQTSQKDHRLSGDLRHGIEQGMLENPQIRRKNGTHLTTPTLHKPRHRQSHQARKDVPTQIPQRTFPRLNKASNPPIGNESLHRQYGQQGQYDPIDIVPHLARINPGLQCLLRRANQTSQKIGKCQ